MCDSAAAATAIFGGAKATLGTIGAVGKIQMFRGCVDSKSEDNHLLNILDNAINYKERKIDAG